MDGQNLQILENAAIDGFNSQSSNHFEAINYYQDKLDTAQNKLSGQGKFWSFFKIEWEKTNPEIELCKEMIRQNIETIDELETSTQKRIDYIYRNEPEQSEVVNFATLEA